MAMFFVGAVSAALFVAGALAATMSLFFCCREDGLVTAAWLVEAILLTISGCSSAKSLVDQWLFGQCALVVLVLGWTVLTVAVTGVAPLARRRSDR